MREAMREDTDHWQGASHELSTATNPEENKKSEVIEKSSGRINSAAFYYIFCIIVVNST